MPKQYEAIRDALIAKGNSVGDSKTSAAKIYNAQRKPGARPVSRTYHRDSDRSFGDAIASSGKGKYD